MMFIGFQMTAIRLDDVVEMPKPKRRSLWQFFVDLWNDEDA